MNRSLEIRAQAEALSLMHGNIMTLIGLYAEEFRAIINDYEAMHGKEPTANDLLWIASEHAGRDLTKEEEAECDER